MKYSKKTIPGDLYRDLKIDPGLDVQWDNQGSIPVENSNNFNTKYSPFQIRVIPPSNLDNLVAILQNQAHFENYRYFSPTLDAEVPQRKPGTFSTATSQYNNFNQRTRISNSESSSLTSLKPTIANSLATRTRDAGVYITNGYRSTKADTGAFSEPSFADQSVGLDIVTQLITMLNVPPLRLYINPETFVITHTKVSDYSERGRSGYKYLTWGEGQPSLSVSGRIGAYMALGGQGPLAPGNHDTPASSGLQECNKPDSAAFQQLMQLFQLFRSNGYIFDTLGKSFAQHHIGALAIEYDQWVYVGHMMSFSFAFEEVASHGGLGFSFEFKVSRHYDIASDPIGVVQPYESAGENTVGILEELRGSGPSTNDFLQSEQSLNSTANLAVPSQGNQSERTAKQAPINFR